jgi:hypothetical protein
MAPTVTTADYEQDIAAIEAAASAPLRLCTEIRRLAGEVARYRTLAEDALTSADAAMQREGPYRLMLGHADVIAASLASEPGCAGFAMPLVGAPEQDYIDALRAANDRCEQAALRLHSLTAQTRLQVAKGGSPASRYW